MAANAILGKTDAVARRLAYCGPDGGRKIAWYVHGIPESVVGNEIPGRTECPGGAARLHGRCQGRRPPQGRGGDDQGRGRRKGRGGRLGGQVRRRRRRRHGKQGGAGRRQHLERQKVWPGSRGLGLGPWGPILLGAAGLAAIYGLVRMRRAREASDESLLVEALMARYPDFDWQKFLTTDSPLDLRAYLEERGIIPGTGT